MEDDHHMMRVRMPAGLHRTLLDQAKRNNRSLNAEIIARLTRSSAFDTETDLSIATEVGSGRSLISLSLATALKDAVLLAGMAKDRFSETEAIFFEISEETLNNYETVFGKLRSVLQETWNKRNSR